MKVEITKHSVKKFDPISVNFTMENIRDLQIIVSIFNASGVDLAKFSNDHKPRISINNFSDDECGQLFRHSNWKELIDIYDKL